MRFDELEISAQRENHDAESEEENHSQMLANIQSDSHNFVSSGNQDLKEEEKQEIILRHIDAQ